MHIARTTLAAALLSTSLAAQTPPTTTDWLVLDPTTQIHGLSATGTRLHGGALLDVDDDGRLDLALRGPEGELGFLCDFAGHPRAVPLASESLAPRDMAACERNGRDALLTAGDDGLHLVSWNPQTGRAEALLLLAGSFGRILYARGTGIEGSLAWLMHADKRSLQALLLDSANGNVLMVGPVLALPSDVGAVELVDINHDDHAELALTWAHGILVIDPFANPIVMYPRRFFDSSITNDALVRLVDANGSETVAWLERDQTTLSISTFSNTWYQQLSVPVGDGLGHSALDVDGNGLADLVLGRADGNGVRVLLARPSGPRFEAGGAFDAVTALWPYTTNGWNAPVHFSVGDVDRDGDSDLVRVTEELLDVARSTQLDANDFAPQFVAGSAQWNIDPTETNPTEVSFTLAAPAAAVPVSRLVLSLHASPSPTSNLYTSEQPFSTQEIVAPTWPVEFNLVLPPTAASAQVWYVEARVIGGSSGTHEYPALFVALTSNGDEHLTNEVGQGGSLWRIHFDQSQIVLHGQGTAGSNGEVRIPRLPPPPPPPPAPIDPVTSPTPGTGGG
jgi:hypothetical protein